MACAFTKMKVFVDFQQYNAMLDEPPMTKIATQEKLIYEQYNPL